MFLLSGNVDSDQTSSRAPSIIQLDDSDKEEKEGETDEEELGAPFSYHFFFGF